MRAVDILSPALPLTLGNNLDLPCDSRWIVAAAYARLMLRLLERPMCGNGNGRTNVANSAFYVGNLSADGAGAGNNGGADDWSDSGDSWATGNDDDSGYGEAGDCPESGGPALRNPGAWVDARAEPYSAAQMVAAATQLLRTGAVRYAVDAIRIGAGALSAMAWAACERLALMLTALLRVGAGADPDQSDDDAVSVRNQVLAQFFDAGGRDVLTTRALDVYGLHARAAAFALAMRRMATLVRSLAPLDDDARDLPGDI